MARFLSLLSPLFHQAKLSQLSQLSQPASRSLPSSLLSSLAPLLGCLLALAVCRLLAASRRSSSLCCLSLSRIWVFSGLIRLVVTSPLRRIHRPTDIGFRFRSVSQSACHFVHSVDQSFRLRFSLSAPLFTSTTASCTQHPPTCSSRHPLHPSR